MSIPQDALDDAYRLMKQNRLSEAREALRPILSAAPEHAEALHLAGMVEVLSGAPHEALGLLRRSVELAPQVPFAWCNLGVACNATGNHGEALECFDRMLQLDRGNATALKNRGTALRYLGRHDEAMESFRRASVRAPNDPELHREVGDLLVDMGRPAEALARYDRSIAGNPADANTHHNRGSAAYRAGELERAESDLRRALALAPRFARAYSTLGVVLNDQGRHGEAFECLQRATAIETGDAQFQNNLGIARDHLGRGDAAVAAYDRALAVNPGYAAAWANRGAALNDLGRHADALASYDRAEALDPSLAHVPGHRLHLRMHLCQWSGLDELVARIRSGLEAGRPVSPPFPLLSVPVPAALQRACAELQARELKGAAASSKPKARTPTAARDRIRVGYFSADFRNHPVGYLMPALARGHDRERFEAIAFSFGPATDDATRREIEGAFERFEDVRGRSDAEIVELARRHGIDIAIDLMGYTQRARTAIFARRAAPVQAQYLGYPGTMGADFIDYLIADAVTVADEHLPHFRERIVFLPDTYQVNDAARRVAESAGERASHDLPEGAFVFCCFSNKAKITPDVFDAWMRLLLGVPGSVLWLVRTEEAASANLREEARRRGVEPDRLVFAPRVPIAEHLARVRHADLFLDTFHYTGHATTSDTLLAGVPVITCLAQGFPGRVSASLLLAVGLPELVADSPERYEALALRLARDRDLLGELRARLAGNRAAQPLFDSTRFVRNLERAYATMVERDRAGLAPDHIRVG